MNEDEAFIRAIVDSPGDDTPRLVYADWLDDRADPRGPYLRAEHEWAKKLTATALKKVHKLAKPLDAVWAARVSRPPIGVCLTTDAFSARGPRLTLDDMTEETDTYPDDYLAFLLNYNGGRLLEKVTIATINLRCPIDGFASLGGDSEDMCVRDGAIPTIDQLETSIVHPRDSGYVFQGSIPFGYEKAKLEGYNCLLFRSVYGSMEVSRHMAIVYFEAPYGREWEDEELLDLHDKVDAEETDQERLSRIFSDNEYFLTTIAPSLREFLALLERELRRS